MTENLPARPPLEADERRRLIELRDVYRSGLLDDVLPFWLEHAVDRRDGGYWTALDRDGSLLDSDKAIWFQGRFAWLLCTLYTTVEPRPEWLAAAEQGITFLQRHGFDADGRMYFLVTRDGKPLRKRRYVFSEMFACMALAAWSRAAGDPQAGRRAADLFQEASRWLNKNGRLPPKVDPETRPQHSFSLPMIRLNVAQELRTHLNDDGYTATAAECIEEIRTFLIPEYRAVCETMGADGRWLDHFDGRLLNPGHALEGSWFVMREAAAAGNADFHTLGRTMLDWMWEWGWDEQEGGILYFRDLKDGPVQEYWHDMKFWWPQNEAILATLRAWLDTGDGRYAEWHRQIHDWTHRRFPDPDYGEWFGYLHRDGRLSHAAKGAMWKGPFHIPRMQLLAWKWIDEFLNRVDGV